MKSVSRRTRARTSCTNGCRGREGGGEVGGRWDGGGTEVGGR